MNILFQFNYSSIIYAVTSATTVTQSTTSGTTASTTEETIDPDQDVTNADDDNLGADINDDSGTLLGPLVEIVRAIGDAIMSILTKCLLGTSFESMMVSWDEVDNSKLLEANTSKTYTESEINEFKNAFGNLPDLKYPNFKYTPEEIFKGEIDVFGIDFIGGNTVKNGEVKQNESTGWNSLRKMVSIWYQVLRYIAVIGLLSILIYLGIKIILSSSAGKKAEYKSALINWVIAMFLIFIMHYIMAFIIVLIQKFTTLLGKSIGNIKNIKFEIIIINSNLENFTNEINIIEKLCSKSKYVIINTDINLQFEILNQDKTNIITYGLNQKADVTVSSITDANILIYLQKNILNRKNQIIEIGEKRIKISENERVMVYEILIIYIIYLINYNTIINKTQEKSNFFEQN